ncbi:unnamed protein product, partial [Nesidiocoris tenuis]
MGVNTRDDKETRQSLSPQNESSSDTQQTKIDTQTSTRSQCYTHVGSTARRKKEQQQQHTWDPLSGRQMFLNGPRIKADHGWTHRIEKS